MLDPLKDHPFAPNASLAGDPNAGYARAKRVYGLLSKRAYQSRNHHDFEDDLLLEICEIVSPNAPAKDVGVASAIRAGMVESGFLTAHPTDDPQVTEYRKAARCPKPDSRSWEDAQNDHLRRLQAMERSMIEEEWANQDRIAGQAKANDPRRRELAWLLPDLMREMGVVTRDELAGVVEAAVEAALERRSAAV